ncbi:hypothetical protein RFA42_004169 [Vibrio vulnificus]|uniref:phospholipase D-like domain-containing protein n=1 Tax=Vibrio vulnificus TaxID=672 RepID=UPI0013EE6D42|nr:phospholipase D-like domain-containing protein [Vibrio vulnificus]EKZ9203354.1 hypothetical protein [Vibrio vulnificus]MCA3975472.1 hypothetical protein [Vibrio vulnificus]HDY7484325.1 hypothetical protein [Vibrio vulnificus]HDY7855492.1 hypothetical protein [Vibrio vulnificus]
MIKTETYFEDIQYHILHKIRGAKESIRICVAWISGDLYDQELRALAKKGVKIEVIFNDDSTNANYGISNGWNIDSYPINTRLSSAFMHNKFCIIDEQILITGSYNWSKKAGDSFENIVMIYNDYELIKSYLHEFYDLIAYYRGYSQNYISKCSCRSNIFHLAVMGPEEGLYSESKIDIWSICVKNHHVSHLGEEYTQHLRGYLGLKDAPDWKESPYTKYSMQGEFSQERSQIESVQSYFNQKGGIRVHAVAEIGSTNWHEQIEYGDAPEYVLSIIWRDMYFRKIIPETIYDDGYDGINKIISEHV